MGTAIKHPVPHRVKLSFVIFDIRTCWCSQLSVRVPRCQNHKWRHRMLYSCTHMATVGVNGLRASCDIGNKTKLQIWQTFASNFNISNSDTDSMNAVSAATTHVHSSEATHNGFLCFLALTVRTHQLHQLSTDTCVVDDNFHKLFQVFLSLQWLRQAPWQTQTTVSPSVRWSDYCNSLSVPCPLAWTICRQHFICILNSWEIGTPNSIIPYPRQNCQSQFINIFWLYIRLLSTILF